MAEFWTNKGWVSDEGKSVATVDKLIRKYKSKASKAQIYIAIERAIYHPTYKGENPYKTNKTYKEIGIVIFESIRGSLVIYHGNPTNFYPEYFRLNE